MQLNQNLPSTRTSQKMGFLFLTVLLSANKVSGGQGYENCIASSNSPDLNYYNALLNYPLSLNSGQALEICCNANQCSTNFPCLSVTNAFLAKVNNFEIGVSPITNSCVGIVGNTTITSNTTLGSDCPSDITTTANYLQNIVSEINGLNQDYAQ